MNRPSWNRIFHLQSVMIIWLLVYVEIAVAAILPEPDKGFIRKITSVSVERAGDATSLIVTGDGGILDYMTRTIAFPPRIVVDIPTDGPPAKSMVQQISNDMLKSFRVGYHAERIRLVLDIKKPYIPDFSTVINGNILVVTLRPPHVKKTENDQSAPEESPVNTPDTFTNTSGKSGIKNANVSTKENLAGNVSGTLRQDKDETSHVDNEEMFFAAERLTQMEEIDDPASVLQLVSGIEAYQSQDWVSAINHLTQFLETSPDDAFAEKAHFLLAKSYHQLYSERLILHFNDVKSYYEDAIYRYPQSIYVPDAYLSIGNLCLQTDIYSEALGYYNVVIEMEKHVYATLQALMLKAKLFSMKNKKEEALAIYRSVQRQYSGTSEAVKAKIEMAKILFEMNQFQKSLGVLSQLEGTTEYIYQYPDISRYLGDNHYQIGNFAKAREHLFRYYNICPDEQDSHLMLARIADAYREDGHTSAATAFYQLVLDRYPETEGALISMYRIAEQQEKGEVKTEKGITPNVSVIGNDIYLPRKIYEDVIQNAIEEDESSPLTQFALLKLSILDRKEKKYDSSITILKNLIENYPLTKLRKEIEHAFAETLLSILKRDYKIKKYKHIINTYQKEKKTISNLNSPEIFIIIARSAINLKLDDMSVDMFKKAANYLPDEEKPPDLIFCLAKDSFEKGDLKESLSYLDLLMLNHSDDKYISSAFLLKGKILSSLKKHRQASEMFSFSLQRSSKRCEQPAILVQKAMALIEIGSKETAYQTLSSADRISRGCLGSNNQIYEDIGKLYIRIGYPQDALSVIQFALDLDKGGKHRNRLKVLMARCHEMMSNKAAYIAIYNEVANQNDPFWRNVAKEKMDEMRFRSVIRKEKK